MKTIYLSVLFAIISNISIGQEFRDLDDNKNQEIYFKNRQVNNNKILVDKSEESSVTLDKAYSYLYAPVDTLISKKILRKTRRHGIGFNGFGPTNWTWSIYYNAFLNNSFSVELGTDFRAYYCGINYYPFSNKEWAVTPYIGAFVNYTTDVSLFEAFDAPEKGVKGYFPIGLQTFSQNGWIFSIEVAVSTVEFEWTGYLFWGVKLGYQFRKK